MTTVPPTMVETTRCIPLASPANSRAERRRSSRVVPRTVQPPSRAAGIYHLNHTPLVPTLPRRTSLPLIRDKSKISCGYYVFGGRAHVLRPTDRRTGALAAACSRHRRRRHRRLPRRRMSLGGLAQGHRAQTGGPLIVRAPRHRNEARDGC